MPVMFCIDVDTPSRSYKVRVGRDMATMIVAGVRLLGSARRVALITDSNVAELHMEPLAHALEEDGLEVERIVFPAGEANKTLDTLGDLLERMAEASLTRDDVVVALGGGVTGDMGGLAAALYLRGIALIQVPTSLLAMVDSSVGGKTAVDIPAGKNLVGAFKQPDLVVADVEHLATLPRELVADGFGEIIKHAVAFDASFFHALEAAPITSVEGLEEIMGEIVARNVIMKRDIVVEDEKESGARQLLNFGHTIGHAIEAAEQFRMSHGACVAAGMCTMTRATEALGWTEPGTAAAIESCCEAYGLPTRTRIAPDVLMEYMLHDKKRHADTMNIVVCPEIGRTEVRTVGLDELARIVELGCGEAS